MTTLRPQLEQHLLDILDAIEEPVSIATAIRDRDGRILDFRLEFVNEATARWAGVSRESMVGLITGELLPEFRSSGFFDTLAEVVETGVPYSEGGAEVADAVTGGQWVGGIYDMRAIRLGDGYMSTWRQRAVSPEPG
ncbi:MAG TPA: PAS domain-containing protein [Candidatus Limnocylindria bacterium]|nr:PAS domain-containing protein [Candidatus Limnocylindria bacterium]